MKIVDAASIVLQDRLADGADEDGLPILLFDMHRVFRRRGWGLELPGVDFRPIQRRHENPFFAKWADPRR